MKGTLIAGAAALGGLMIFVDDIGSLIAGAIVGSGAVAAARLRKKDKVS